MGRAGARYACCDACGVASLRPANAPTLYAALLLATTVAFVASRHRAPPRATAPHAALPAATVAHATRDDLTLAERPLTPPPSMLNEQGCYGGPRRWAFPGTTREATAARLSRALRGPGLELALSSIRCAADGCVVDAPAAVVAAVDPAARDGFYGELAGSPLNPAYAFPFRRFPARPPFAASPGLPPAAREFVARASWSRAGVQYFADLTSACERAGTDDDRRALVRAIHLPWTLDVGLRTDPRAADRLVATAPLRLRPALRAALSRAAGAGRAAVPLDDVLPGPARRRHGTWAGAGEEHLNCFWTALHFEDGDPGERLLDLPSVEAALRARYERLDDVPARFGDVMAFRAADGALEHLAVHLFAGVFFTKDGVSVVQPWRVARVEDVLLDYPNARRVELWRRRDDP